MPVKALGYVKMSYRRIYGKKFYTWKEKKAFAAGARKGERKAGYKRY